MILAAADLTGWWVGYAIGAAIVIVVALLLVLIIRTARAIAAAADEATRCLAEARDRTEALWRVTATNELAADILEGARRAREALEGR
jgi:hypothetical protein